MCVYVYPLMQRSIYICTNKLSKMHLHKKRHTQECQCKQTYIHVNKCVHCDSLAQGAGAAASKS